MNEDRLNCRLIYRIVKYINGLDCRKSNLIFKVMPKSNNDQIFEYHNLDLKLLRDIPFTINYINAAVGTRKLSN